MDSFTWLLFLCIAMFLGAYGSGYIPLAFSMSEKRLRFVTIFGAGLLVGTALIVIIPEGVAMHYEGQNKRAKAGSSLTGVHAGHNHGRRLLETTSLAGESQTGAGSDEDFSHAHPGHYQIGAALAFGFAFQLLVDRLSGHLHSHTSSVAIPATSPIPTADGESRIELNVRANTGGDHSAKSKSAMVGMVVHCFVDGVALGAAVREGDSTLGILVFLAIMLHKAPSAFGLSSYLLHHGISHDGVKKRLLAFSSSAPLGALFTYSLLSANIFTYKQEMLALCLLFSGGTFLYVATAHVLPEIQSSSGSDTEGLEEVGADAECHGHSHGGSHGKVPPRMSWPEVWTLIAGVLFPLLLDVHHGH